MTDDNLRSGAVRTGSAWFAVDERPIAADREEVNHLDASPEYPGFDALMGGAFNQDWKDEWSSVDEVLSEALDGFPATRRALLPELLQIRETCSEADVVELLESMSSGFRPEVDAQVSALGWVDRLVQRINALDAADV
ncbi:contact-dependent growth inhibition system immunity protein [Curtobacterium sp. 1544]|uniref:contact-dependent growth inhibition system immunity protein n=1 Tax=Curtobacterium sp. 1544 TaxID=3156417 RepID=UPI003391B919